MNAEKGITNTFHEIESSYVFETIEKLTADFMAEVKRIRSERTR
jgi:hypothetical protein